MLQRCVTKLSPPFIAKRGNALLHLASTVHKSENTYAVQSKNALLKSIAGRTASTTSSSAAEKEEDVDEAPVTFTKSKGFKTKPLFINPRPKESHPPFQDFSIFISMSSLMIYFFLLREENDMDEALGVSLYDRIPGMEKSNLIAAIRHNEQEGLDTTALKARLDEIIAEEEKEKSDYDEKEQELSKLYKKD